MFLDLEANSLEQALQGMVEGLVQKNKALQKIDDGVEKQGWRMLKLMR